MTKRILILILCLFAEICVAQKENNTWYFGAYAGLDFNSGAPVALTNSAMTTSEGCASVSDTAGNLLFYTDGTSIWNRNHVVMPNGTGLTGNNTSTQSALIVKAPGSTGLYYVFTSFTVLAYSTVDMSLNGGLGDVSIKNDTLTTRGSEKLCGAAHTNGVDYWILSHERATNGFNAFCVSTSGVSHTPVHSNAGFSTAGGPGQMKISPPTDHVAFGQPGASFGDTTVYVGDFDCATGTVSGGFAIVTPGNSQVYGLEFSPNGRFLYTPAISTFDVQQYDLNAGSPAAIIASVVVVGNAGRQITSMQLGPDHTKLYISVTNNGYVDAINDPDSLGTACNFQTNAVFLAGKTCRLGLPNFITAFFNCNMICATPLIADFTSSDTVFCDENGRCLDFTDHSTGSPTSWQWLFPGANPDTSSLQNPTSICYTIPGTYSVTLITTNTNGADTLTVPSLIVLASAPLPPVVTTYGDTVTTTHYDVYQWYFNGFPISGATDSSYVATQSGTYSVRGTDSLGCSSLSNGVYVDMTAVNIMANEGEIRIFPNPAKELFTVYGLPFTGGATLELYTMIGEKVLSLQLTGSSGEPQTVNCKPLAAGVYILTISSTSMVINKKVILEK